MKATRDQLVSFIGRCGLDEFDCEDAGLVVDILSEAMTPLQIMTWLSWPDDGLEGVPMEFFREGRGREVIVRARRLVGERSS